MNEEKRLIIVFSPHEPGEKERAALALHFDHDAEVVVVDFCFGDDSAAELTTIIQKTQRMYNGRVVGVAASVRSDIIQHWTQTSNMRGITFLFRELRRDEAGRLVVVGQDRQGRNVFDFYRYRLTERTAVIIAFPVHEARTARSVPRR